MLGEVLIALTVLTLLCLYGSGDRTNPRESNHYTQQDDDFLDE
jgi:hypothetical protein